MCIRDRLADQQRVLIIEDVTTAGTSIRETVPILKSAANIKLAGLIVSVDRAERGPSGDGTAMQEVGNEFNMPTFAIVTVHEIMKHVELPSEDQNRMEVYLQQYGARPAN